MLSGKLPNNGVFSPPLTWRAQLQMEKIRKGEVLKPK